MRIGFALPFLALAALSAVPSAQAQDACTQASPCLWEVVVDQPGFIDESSWNWTLGDWMVLTVSNDDEAPHTVSLSGYDRTFLVAGLSEGSQTFQLTRSGTFTLKDMPSGDEVQVTVVDGDVVDYEKGLIDVDGNPRPTSTTGRIPGPGLALLATTLFVAAFISARRTRKD
ncbi:MAG TPA: hypothetical protein VM286_03575 [Candidatus Thermoplasmatota archaeon]|nr:hypothetical protein [Candidatus Thermoplasmatota archaeon]